MTDRNAAKRKRAARNKAAREALEVRRTKAAEAQDRRAAAEPEPEPRKPARGRGAGASSKGSKPDAGRASRPARPPAPTGVDGRPARGAGAGTEVVGAPTGGVRGYLSSVVAVPGGKGVLFAFALALVASVTLVILPVPIQPALRGVADITRDATNVDVPALEDLEKPPLASDSLLTVIGWQGALILLVPVMISGIALQSSLRETRSRTYLFSAIALAAFIFFTSNLGIGIIFIPPLIGLGYGAYKSRQADAPTTGRRGGLFSPPPRNADTDDANDHDDVIDTEAVEDSSEDDERR